MTAVRAQVRHLPKLVTLTEIVAVLVLLLDHALGNGQRGRRRWQAGPHELAGRRVAAALATHAALWARGRRGGRNGGLLLLLLLAVRAVVFWPRVGLHQVVAQNLLAFRQLFLAQLVQSEVQKWLTSVAGRKNNNVLLFSNPNWGIILTFAFLLSFSSNCTFM